MRGARREGRVDVEDVFPVVHEDRFGADGAESLVGPFLVVSEAPHSVCGVLVELLHVSFFVFSVFKLNEIGCICEVAGVPDQGPKGGDEIGGEVPVEGKPTSEGPGAKVRS